ncbi:MAG: hypothetical protein L0229_27075, partial [Blastocatellia bacterium]|nr:hypothetical protein [Blastocatellia bacterium]
MFSKSFSVAVALLLLQGIFGTNVSASLKGRKEDRLLERQSTYSEQEKAKLQLAEEAADRFIQRWHEILDFGILFDEMYVSNPAQRRRNIDMFASQDEAKGLDEQTGREGFIAFCNMWYLGAEYMLSVQTEDDEPVSLPPEIAKARKALKKLKPDDDELTSNWVMQFIVRANNLSSAFRKYLSPDVFESALYKTNLKGFFDEAEPSEILYGLSEYGVAKDQEVYKIKRGMFEFYF